MFGIERTVNNRIGVSLNEFVIDWVFYKTLINCFSFQLVCAYWHTLWLGFWVAQVYHSENLSLVQSYEDPICDELHIFNACWVLKFELQMNLFHAMVACYQTINVDHPTPTHTYIILAFISALDVDLSELAVGNPVFLHSLWSGNRSQNSNIWLETDQDDRFERTKG